MAHPRGRFAWTKVHPTGRRQMSPSPAIHRGFPICQRRIEQERGESRESKADDSHSPANLLAAPAVSFLLSPLPGPGHPSLPLVPKLRVGTPPVEALLHEASVGSVCRTDLRAPIVAACWLNGFSSQSAGESSRPLFFSAVVSGLRPAGGT